MIKSYISNSNHRNIGKNRILYILQSSFIATKLYWMTSICYIRLYIGNNFQIILRGFFNHVGNPRWLPLKKTIRQILIQIWSSCVAIALDDTRYSFSVMIDDTHTYKILPKDITWLVVAQWLKALKMVNKYLIS